MLGLFMLLGFGFSNRVKGMQFRQVPSSLVSI